MCRIIAAWVLSVALLSACRSESLRERQGALVLVTTGPEGTELLGREVTVDFGALVIGKSASRTVVLKNLGPGSLVVGRISSSPESSMEAFRVALDREVVLGPAEELRVEVSFTPPESDRMAQDYVAVLSVHAENAAEGAEEAVLTLRGRGIQAWCDVPDALDFGAVEAGSSYELAFELDNPTELDARAWIADIEGADAAAFAFVDPSVRGEFLLPARTTRTVRVRFSPSEMHTYVAQVRVQGEGACWQNEVLFTGRGVSRTLVWTPDSLDFGAVRPGTSATRKVTLTNLGNAELEVTEVRTSVVTSFSATPSRLTVPAKGGTAEIEMTFHPTHPGSWQGELEFATPLPSLPEGVIPLTGFAGGPVVQVAPSSLEFGRVAWFANAPEASARVRPLTVRNVGTRQDPKKTEQNLHLAFPVKVVPANPDTHADEFSVSLAAGASYDSTVGISPESGENALRLEVTLSPRSEHRKEALLVFGSNDPVTPEVSVRVTADVVVLPRCECEVSATSLEFGVLAPYGRAVRSFVIRNLGERPGDVCLVSNLELLPGADPSFSIVGGPIAEAMLQPGQSLEVRVEANSPPHPEVAYIPARGLIGFHVSSDLNPEVLVQVSANLLTSCVHVTTPGLSLGYVELGCASPRGRVLVYNNCPDPVLLHRIDLVDAAGQPAGGPGCPGITPCPEFELMAAPALPPGGRVMNPGGNPVSVDVRYRPLDLGLDWGRIELGFSVGGFAFDSSITLDGQGKAQVLHTDSFVQPPGTAADVLFVVDGSGSMAAHQESLGRNMVELFESAAEDGIDYRIAVLRGQGPGSNPTLGEFLSGPGHPDRILGPQTADVEDQFRAKVESIGALGGDEQCFEPALRALSSPLSGSVNAGFLRPQVPLSIVCVTDDRDHSPQTSYQYRAAFQALKGVNRPELLTVSAIAVFQGLCGLPDDGRYAWMVAATGGARGDICNTDWATTLRTVGETAFGRRRTFPLQTPADLSRGALDVQVNGAAVPETTPTGETVWTWDPVTNAVTFERAHRPGPGAAVDIAYYGRCF